jgi:hypothetical protein
MVTINNVPENVGKPYLTPKALGTNNLQTALALFEETVHS